MTPRRIGVAVYCTVCRKLKKPIGRSGPLVGGYCTREDCEGYCREPFPGSLWPDETDAEFGHAVGRNGTKEVG